MKVMSCLFYTLFLAVFSSSVVVASSVIKEQEGLFVSQKTLSRPMDIPSARSGELEKGDGTWEFSKKYSRMGNGLRSNTPSSCFYLFGDEKEHKGDLTYQNGQKVRIYVTHRYEFLFRNSSVLNALTGDLLWVLYLEDSHRAEDFVFQKVIDKSGCVLYSARI